MTTSWRTLATVPRLGLATLVQVAAAWAGATDTTTASVNRMMVRRRRVRAGPEREAMMPPSPHKGATQGIRSVRAAESRCRMAAVCARLNRPSRFALEGPDLATAAGRVRFPRTTTLHPAGEGGGSTMPQPGGPRTKVALLTGR